MEGYRRWIRKNTNAFMYLLQKVTHPRQSPSAYGIPAKLERMKQQHSCKNPRDVPYDALCDVPRT